MADPKKPASALSMLFRGITGRCPLCGGGHVRRNWFSLKDRCPTCGHKFLRRGDQALALGGYMIQIIFVFGAMLLVMFLFIAKNAGASGIRDIPNSVFGWVLAAIIVIGTLGLYPFTKMLWVATDLAMDPPSMLEQANAALAQAQGDEAANEALNRAMNLEAARKRDARRRRGADGAAANKADEQLAIDIAAGRVTGAEAERQMAAHEASADSSPSGATNPGPATDDDSAPT